VLQPARATDVIAEIPALELLDLEVALTGLLLVDLSDCPRSAKRG